ncbi:hypothetical protein AHAS_Ahas14G0100900 [Arachis hypogaea]
MSCREQDDYEVVRKVGRGKYNEVFDLRAFTPPIMKNASDNESTKYRSHILFLAVLDLLFPHCLEKYKYNLVENLLDFEYELKKPYLLYRNAAQEVNVLSPLSPGWQAKLIFNSHQIVVPNFHFHCSRRNRKPNNHQSSTLLQKLLILYLISAAILIHSERKRVRTVECVTAHSSSPERCNTSKLEHNLKSISS